MGLKIGCEVAVGGIRSYDIPISEFLFLVPYLTMITFLVNLCVNDAQYGFMSRAKCAFSLYVLVRNAIFCRV